jgi:hypothetical protein
LPDGSADTQPLGSTHFQPLRRASPAFECFDRFLKKRKFGPELAFLQNAVETRTVAHDILAAETGLMNTITREELKQNPYPF